MMENNMDDKTISEEPQSEGSSVEADANTNSNVSATLSRAEEMLARLNAASSMLEAAGIGKAKDDANVQSTAEKPAIENDGIDTSETAVEEISTEPPSEEFSFTFTEIPVDEPEVAGFPEFLAPIEDAAMPVENVSETDSFENNVKDNEKPVENIGAIDNSTISPVGENFAADSESNFAELENIQAPSETINDERTADIPSTEESDYDTYPNNVVSFDDIVAQQEHEFDALDEIKTDAESDKLVMTDARSEDSELPKDNNAELMDLPFIDVPTDEQFDFGNADSGDNGTMPPPTFNFDFGDANKEPVPSAPVRIAPEVIEDQQPVENDADYEYVSVSQATEPATRKAKDIIGEYYIFFVCLILVILGIVVINVGTTLPAFFIILAFAAIAALLIYAIYSAWKTKRKAELAYERGKAIYETVHQRVVEETDTPVDE